MKPIIEMNEAELRDANVPWPTTQDELQAYIGALVNRPHDYGTCVYAMSMAATAAFYYASHKLGVTGFQASCADMDFIRRTRSIKGGFRLVKYENLLYPQYCDNEHFPSWQELMRNNAQWLKDEAVKLLAERKEVAPAVAEHWHMLSKLEPRRKQEVAT